MTDAASAIMGNHFDCGCEEWGLGYACNNDSNFCKLKIRQGKINMATRLVKQADLECAFPNEIQRKAFLDMMQGLIMVEPKPEHTPESVLQKSINRQSAFPTGEVNPRTLIAALKMKGYEIVRRHGITEL